MDFHNTDRVAKEGDQLICDDPGINSIGHASLANRVPDWRSENAIDIGLYSVSYMTVCQASR
ncbi:hypothetical protein A8B75_13870 [Sphingomonadales bacterium EhC05]|nr:hypothetical protein A8B75_13870 [Sphingomonadales bacterium EhC05]